MVQLHYPPANPDIQGRSCKLFLAGTIDNGESYNWQREVYEFISNKFNLCCLDVMNPRRPDWNSSWSGNHPMLRRQIEWELNCLEKADIIAMVLLPDSKSPISLMELGAFKDKPMLIYCPKEFYRYQNVETFVRKYMDSRNLYDDWDMYKIALRRLVESFILKTN